MEAPLGVFGDKKGKDSESFETVKIKIKEIRINKPRISSLCLLPLDSKVQRKRLEEVQI